MGSLHPKSVSNLLGGPRSLCDHDVFFQKHPVKVAPLVKVLTWRTQRTQFDSQGPHEKTNNQTNNNNKKLGMLAPSLQTCVGRRRQADPKPGNLVIPGWWENLSQKQVASALGTPFEVVFYPPDTCEYMYLSIYVCPIHGHMRTFIYVYTTDYIKLLLQTFWWWSGYSFPRHTEKGLWHKYI